MLAEAAARPTSAKSSATTGGDVSRFWVPVRGRVSAPRQPQQQQSYSGAPVSMGPAAPQGPVVRVTRGDKVTEITVGGK
jgi:pilus assembly protein CpaB